MIRKRPVSVKEEEDKRQAWLLAEKERQEKRRQSINRITDSIRSTYSYIKPTIVQGQRVLKVIEKWESRVNAQKYTDQLAIQKILESDSVLKPKEKRLLVDLKEKQQQYKAIRYQLEEKRLNLLAYSNDDQINENAEDLSDEQKQLLQELKQIQDKLEIVKQELIHSSAQLIDYLLKNKDLMQTIDRIEGLGNSENYIDLLTVSKGLRFVYHKQLTTGYDEELNYQNQLRDIKDKIVMLNKYYEEKIVQQQEIRASGVLKNQQLNTQIEQHRNELDRLKKEEQEEADQVSQKFGQFIDQQKVEYKAKKKALQEYITKLKSQLQEYEKQNNEQESLLRKQIDEKKSRLKSVIQEYDQFIESLEDKIDKLNNDNQQLQNQLEKIDEEYRYEIYKQTQLDFIQHKWKERQTEIDIDLERKQNAAKYIYKIWSNFKQKNQNKKQKNRKQAKENNNKSIEKQNTETTSN